MILHTFPEQKSDKARIKILISFCSHIICTGIYTGNFGYLFLSLQKSQNTVNSPKKSIFALFLGVKCYINQDLNEISTIPCVNTCRMQLGIQLESLVYVSAAEVEISRSECEKKLILRKQPLKICIVKFYMVKLMESTGASRTKWSEMKTPKCGF